MKTARRVLVALLAVIIVALPTSAWGAPLPPKAPYAQPVLFAQTIETSSQIRLPTGDYGATGTWAVFPATLSTKWDKVDDEDDGDATYLTHGTTAGYSLFNFTAFAVPAGAIVTKLEITYSARDVTAGVNNLRPALRVGGTNYLTTSTGIDLGTGYLAVTYAYVVNPRTTAAWTVADINGTGTNPLQQFGVNSSDANPAFRITSVTARVSYTQVVDTLAPPVYPAMDDGTITLAELTTEATSDAREGVLTFAQWDSAITTAGINHIDDKLLADFVNAKAGELTEQYTQLYELYTKAPVKEQVAQINTNLIKLETQKTAATAALVAAKAGGDKDAIQQAADKVAALDGKISELTQPLQVASQIQSIESGIAVVKNKFKLALKEQEFRADQLVTRTYAHTVYYMDFTPSTHSHLTGVVTFTNGSTAVTSAGGNMDPEVTVGDYIRQSDGTQWYKVTARAAAADDACTITPAFQQATHTDDNGATFICVSATNTGLAIATAFPHLNRYTTDTTRTAGDILKVRANQTNVIAGINITFDEDGTAASYLEIRGCSVADDPFSDASNVQPIFDFGNTAFQFTISGDDYWRIYNLTTTNSSYTAGIIGAGSGKGLLLDTLTVYGNTSAASGIGISVTGTNPTILNCVVYGNKVKNIDINTGLNVKIKGCTINGGAATTDYGVYSDSANVEIIDTTFGGTTTHDTASVTITTNGGNIQARNCTFTDAVEFTSTANGISFQSEDHDGVMGAAFDAYSSGTITKSTTVLRVGGGLSSALLLPSSVATIIVPLSISNWTLVPDFAVWCPASPTTVTVYMRANTIWATYPTAAQLFIQADYWAGVTAIRSQSTSSNQTLIDNREPAGAGTYTADAGTNTTTVVDAGLAGTAYIGKYLYNSTRSAGAEITNYVDGTKTITLGTAIASQTTGDTYYILDWVAFTTTLTPGTAGFVYIKINLGLYASGKGVYVGVKPVTS
jgi:hypothetical protein